MGEVSDVITSTPVPEVVAETVTDLTEVIERLDVLVNLNMSIYAWVALFITLVLGGWVIYQVLKPLIYFIR